MSHQDLQVTPERLNAEYLRVALQWLFVGVGWSVVGFRVDCTWTPQWLSSTAESGKKGGKKGRWKERKVERKGSGPILFGTADAVGWRAERSGPSGAVAAHWSGGGDRRTLAGEFATAQPAAARSAGSHSSGAVVQDFLAKARSSQGGPDIAFDVWVTQEQE